MVAGDENPRGANVVKDGLERLVGLHARSTFSRSTDHEAYSGLAQARGSCQAQGLPCVQCSYHSSCGEDNVHLVDV